MYAPASSLRDVLLFDDHWTYIHLLELFGLSLVLHDERFPLPVGQYAGNITVGCYILSLNANLS